MSPQIETLQAFQNPLPKEQIYIYIYIYIYMYVYIYIYTLHRISWESYF